MRYKNTDAVPIKEERDLVEVVRCKDCKYAYKAKSYNRYSCGKGCGALKCETDFCSYGERREK